MRRLLLVLTVLVFLPVEAAQASTCQRVVGKIGYRATAIRATSGATCPPIRKKLRTWLNGPVAKGVKAPKGWACSRTSSKKQIAYSCDPGRGRVRFVLRFSLG